MDLAPGHKTQRPEEVRLEDERDAQIQYEHVCIQEGCRDAP
jgi:hypothetical protein